MPGRSTLVLVTCLFTSLAAFGCSESQVADVSKQTAREIIIQTRSEKTSNPSAATKSAADDKAKSKSAIVEKRVYLDASKSMRGFAGHGGNFDRLLGELGYLMGDPKVYKFGSRTKNSSLRYTDLIQPTHLGQEQRSQQYYDLIHNPDDVLFSELSQRGKDALSVYISDGVYSAADAKAGSRVITPLSQWFGNGRVLGIFAMQSAFKGSFYSEKSCSETQGQQCWLEDVNVSNRPFYVFVFSPDEDSFRKLQHDLKAKFKDFTTIAFLDHSINSEGLELPENDSIYDSGKQEDGYYWQMFTSKFFDSDGPSTLRFNLRYVVDKEYPLNKLGCSVSAKYYAWNDSDRSFAASELPATFKTTQMANLRQSSTTAHVDRNQSAVNFPAVSLLGQESTGEPSRPRKTSSKQNAPEPKSPGAPGSQERASQAGSRSTGFQLEIPRDTRTSYSLYYIPITVDVEEITPGIQKLSTDDDSLKKNANQTYRFAEMIKALLTVHVESQLANQLAPPLFLTISN
ncbi:MAG TPA: hypothetical protein VFI24_26065 [Pyrinomonadaceae bacterium]|nr:hypothetical protein [Pyrinomonadaceae bacterium]